MKIGTYYYPEQWPRDQWERDFDNIARLGLQIVHMGEFAWFDLEPSPGKFNFEWLADCVGMAHARGMRVILCTPTAAPPIWLGRDFPETLPILENGQPMRFGGRRHYNPLSPQMHIATRRIVSALADRFGDSPAVIGWQIDNEYGLSFDQSEITHQAFREWLRHKYGNITDLNRAWGTQFWNTHYTDFDQIMMPPSRDPKYANPHQHLDASRFWSWAFAAFNRIQADILKPKIGHRFLTTNFMNLHLDCDPADMAGDLTLSSWDSYPITGWEKEIADQTFRIADPAGIALVHDQMASYQNRWALMELQPGQVNWSGYPVRVHDGAIRLWIWTAFAHGAEFVTTYRYRQPRFGIELFHHGLVGPDGVTLSQGGKEFAQVIEEMKLLNLDSIPPLAEEKYDPRKTVGLVLDFDQLWYYATLPQAKRWNQTRFLQIWYAAICRLGSEVKILRPGMNWPDDLPIIVAPGVQMVDSRLISQFEHYTHTGGNLLLTCRTGLMDRTGQLFEGPLGMPILPLIGASIEAYDGLPENTFGKIQMDERTYDWGVWGDQLKPNENTQTWGTYADHFYAGATAITHCRHERGTVTYVGAFSEPPLVEAILEKLAKTIVEDRITINVLPPRVHIRSRGPYRIAMSYQDKPVTAPAPANAKFIIGKRTTGPADVVVWEE